MLYNLQWRDVATETTTAVTGISGLLYDLTGLSSSTLYEFRVQEDDGTNTSDYSAWFGFETASGAIVGDVTATIVLDTAITGNIDTSPIITGTPEIKPIITGTVEV